MAHELEIINGKGSMMFFGEAPWHGLGTRLKGPATSAQALQAAKMDWKVKLVPMQAVEGRRRVHVPSRFAVVREDRWGKKQCPVFGVVGRNYTPLQNVEAFTFFDAIVGKKEAIFHTAGVLAQGRRVWILAKLPGKIRVVGDDITEKFLLLSNSHDGISAMQVKFTPIRVVCQNTLTMALERGSSVRVNHTKNIVTRLHDTEALLGIIKTGYAEIEKHFQAMAALQINTERLGDYLLKVFPIPKSKDERLITAAAKSRLECERLFSEGIGHRDNGVKGTLWAAYNGITQYVDYKINNQSRDRRLETIWFGEGSSVKTRAYDLALEQVGARN
jgi:phage/plasmid-like protein (TIGR03299 family)